MIDDNTLNQWMRATLRVTLVGVSRGEFPFGAAIFDRNGTPLAICCNRVKSAQDPTCHAEVCAIRAASHVLGAPSLHSCRLISTAQPCGMCLSAAALAGIELIAFGASEAVVRQAGYQALQVPAGELRKQLDHGLQFRGNVLAEECRQLLYDHPRIALDKRESTPPSVTAGFDN
jgi:tRNA(Arg) A34 adenosine deaminase TadA